MHPHWWELNNLQTRVIDVWERTPPSWMNRELTPRPDNIVLITDGLPTQGRVKPGTATVTANQRLELFNKATGALPDGVPVNTILLPMEGDPMAASLYWKLAEATAGAFLSPSKDWP